MSTPRPIATKGRLIALAAVVVAATMAVAWSRVGLLDLPSVPSRITAQQAGLADLELLGRIDRFVRGPGDEAELAGLPDNLIEAARQVRAGLATIAAGQPADGLQQMREGIRQAPDNLALTNAYRMATFQLRRASLEESRRGGHLVADFPPHLKDEPIAFLRELDAPPKSREARLALALAWVDQMLLFPALEIKAPASVEAVDLLTASLDEGDPVYIPALFARGLNHLHRPARLVWPETMKTPPDAAVQDIGRCVAIGRKVGGASPRLQATLALALGDAYVKTGRLGVARSWWQIAQNLCGDGEIQDAVHRRYGWSDETILDDLEAELDRARAELGKPMTDLAFVWN
jgi:hypothetical protein